MPTERVAGIPAHREIQNAEDHERFQRLANLVLVFAKSRPALADDEIIVLSIVASQVALSFYLSPAHQDAEGTINELLEILDNGQLIRSLESKMERMVSGSVGMETRPNAPRPQDMPQIINRWRRSLDEVEDAPGLDDL